MPRSLTVASFLLAALAAVDPSLASAQPADLFLPAAASSAARSVPDVALRSRAVRVHVPALDGNSIRLHLFDDVQLTVERVRMERPSADRLVWVGKDEFGSQVVITVARGVLTGTVYADHRTFQITREPGGLEYRVVEIDPAAFPSDDPDEEGAEQLLAEIAADTSSTTATSTTTSTTTTTTTTTAGIGVMIVWTPKSETAVGGRSAMESLALNAVANANLVYANSGVKARLNLVYAGPVSFSETSSIGTDLSNVRGTSDGKGDAIHSLRNTYAADIVTMIGEYKSLGTCGSAYIMASVSTSFASSSFNIVDRQCALGNLSYTHEVGHNQGMQHNRENAGSATPSQLYAYGYQDPSGYFRTVLAYGSMRRVPHLSSPVVSYNGRVTGTSLQDNARTLNVNASTIAAFRAATSTATWCAYSVSTTSLSFPVGGGSASVTVSAPTGCAWTASEASSWASLNKTSGTGNGSLTVTVQANGSGLARSAVVTVAGKSVTVKQN